MALLLERMGLMEPLRRSLGGGLPALGTCAGLILLSSRILDGVPGQPCFGLLDASVRRNGYGRQLDSFEAELEVEGLEGGKFPGVFIRAPLVEDPGSAEVMATHDGHPVALRKGSVMALCFHPELSDDRRLHDEFLKLAQGAR